VLLRRTGGDKVPRTAQAAEGKRTRFPRTAQCNIDKQIRRSEHELDARNFIYVLVDIPYLGGASVREPSRVHHGISDKGQRTALKRVLDKERIDIDDPIAEAFIGSRRAVMRLVRMQDVALPRQAVPLLTPEAKSLNARKGDTNRIGVVTMRGKSLTVETGLQTFDAIRP